MNHKNQLKHDSNGGFTLIELIVVVAILAMLAAGLVPAITTQIKRENIEQTKEEIMELHTVLREYYKDVGAFPAQLRDLETDPGVSGWDGPYIRSGFEQYDYEKDGWDVNYNYNYTVNSTSSTLRSAGADKTLGTSDDIPPNGSPPFFVEGKDIMKFKRARIKKELDIVKEAAQDYYDGEGSYPSNIGVVYNRGYLEDDSYRQDEWGQDYVTIDADGDGNPDRFISQGPDGSSSTSDDVYPN